MLLILVLERIIVWQWFRRQEREKQYLILCGRNFKVLSLLGLKRAEGETLEEFADRIGTKVGNEAISFIKDLEASVYGEKPVSAEGFELIANCNMQLKKLLREQRGLWIWLYYILFTT